MSLFFNLPEGSWWLESKSDQRWNCNGRADCVGGFVMPEECQKQLKKLKRKLGEPPADLTWGYMKD